MKAYDQIIEQVFSATGEKQNLSDMEGICAKLGHPEKKFKTVHVAGTNGKGSVSLKIAKTLELAGYKVGLFTSPHLFCFRERIQINGQKIPEEAVVRILSPILKKKLTFFEYCTLLAFLFFAEENVDIAIIEVGLGGRCDATNIVHPSLSIITSIDFDHTELLGKTLELIAKEKAGIIKYKTPVLIGPSVPYEVILQEANHKNAPLTQIHGTFAHYGLENAAIAKKALEMISHTFPTPQKAIDLGLLVEPPCRFEQILPNIIFDVAHNQNGIAKLIERLFYTYPKELLHFAIAFSASKDIGACAKLIEKAAASIQIIHLEHHRIAKPAEIQKHFQKPINVVLPEKIEHPGGILVITGSFFIMEQVMSNMINKTYENKSTCRKIPT